MIYKQENDIGEAEIIGLLRKGNEKALDLIFKRHHTALLYFAQQYLKNRLEAEDIIAEAFIAVWKRRNDFNTIKAIRSFLYVTVRNGCLNQVKQTFRRTNLSDDISYHVNLMSAGEEELIIDQMIKAEFLQRLWQDVENLPPVRRRIFKMFFSEGLSVLEIAKKLKITVDTVRVQKARALHQLKAFVKRNTNKCVFLLSGISQLCIYNIAGHFE